MEYENKYDNRFTSKGVGGSALGLAIGALGLNLLNGNGLGILGNNCGNAACSESMLVNRYEATQAARIAELATEVKLRDANIYTDGKLNDLRNYVDGRFACVNDKLSAQAVHNATNDAVLACMQGQIAQLMSLTALRIPNTSVCPGWGNVTITPATTATT